MFSKVIDFTSELFYNNVLKELTFFYNKVSTQKSNENEVYKKQLVYGTFFNKINSFENLVYTSFLPLKCMNTFVLYKFL